ncbi:hypothetical protein [Streptomyces sp. NPDC048282]|uniref:hypothetical protein n=1 Tax=Streptomyces sp. NPDC048282 TaxID=3365528 RepID=UPI003717BEB2
MSASEGSGLPAGDAGAEGNDTEQKNYKLQITLGVIAALAVVTAAVVPALINGSTETPSGPSGAGGTATQSASSASTGSATCDLETLSNKWMAPDAEVQNRPRYQEGTTPQVRTKISGGDNPGIEVQGQIQLKPHNGEDLILAVWPDPNTHDTQGNKGSGNYYPHGIIEPDEAGCWSDPPHLVGYPGVRGISEVYSLALVPQSEGARLLAEAKGRDGFTPKEWGSSGVTTVFSFTISTA